MHPAFLHLLIVVIAIVLFVSCKKNEAFYNSAHAFWFDKDTKDSMVKSGTHYITAIYDYTAQNGEAGFTSIVDTLSYLQSFPDCDAKNLLFLKIKLKKGEQKTINYTIFKSEKDKDGFTWNNNSMVRSWQGSFIIAQGSYSQTQLKW